MSGANTSLRQTTRVLGLYRKLLRIGKAMPTETRSALVLSRVKSDFRANMKEQDPEEIEDMIQLAELQVDNLEIQRDHLTELAKNPNLIIPVDIYKNAKPRISKFMKGPPLSWERKAAQQAKSRAGLQVQQPQVQQERQQRSPQQQQQQQQQGHRLGTNPPHGSPGHNCKNH